jgi:hypothetical protein
MWPEWAEPNDSLWWVEVSHGENTKKKENWLGELALRAPIKIALRQSCYLHEQKARWDEVLEEVYGSKPHISIISISLRAISSHFNGGRNIRHNRVLYVFILTYCDALPSNGSVNALTHARWRHATVQGRCLLCGLRHATIEGLCILCVVRAERI